MTEEEKIFAGRLFTPADAGLKAKKLRAHNLCTAYNQTFEDETEKRASILSRLLGLWGKGVFCRGPSISTTAAIQKSGPIFLPISI